MVLKNNNGRSILPMVVAATVVAVVLLSLSDATAAPRLLKHSNPAEASTMVYHSQAEIYWDKLLPKMEMPQFLKDIMPTKNSSDGMKNYHPEGCAVGFSYSWAPPLPPPPPPSSAQVKSPVNPTVGVEETLRKFGQVFVTKPEVKVGSTIKRFWPPVTKRGQNFLNRVDIGEKPLPIEMGRFKELMKRLGINPNARDEKFYLYSISTCQPNIGKIYKDREEHRCVFTLEDMIDYSIESIKSSDPEVYISTVVRINNSSSWSGQEVQEFQVRRLEPLTRQGKPSVSCHTLPFPSALFLCHKIPQTSTYRVQLESHHMLINSIMACHHDTSWWDPKSLALQMLNLKPGTTLPICHFLEHGHLVWVDGE